MSLTRSLMSVDLGRGTRRFQRFVTLGGAKPSGGEPPRPRGVLDPELLRSALPHAFRKLDPRLLIRNPVMFVVEITAALVTLICARRRRPASRPCPVPPASASRSRSRIWLWFTVLFATYAEAVAEARGRAQAATLRRTRSETTAHRRRADGTLEDVGSSELRKGDVIVVEEGEIIPGDGDVIEGVGFVNEAAITGESAPGPQGARHRHPQLGHRRHDARQRPARHPRHDRPGRDVPRPHDRARRGRQAPADAQRDRPRDPARRPDDRVPDGDGHAAAVRRSTPATTVETVALVALLVCLIPTTIGGLLSAIGIAGMDRVARFNVLAMSGRAVEASGDVDVILLDKTGTITYGNRLAASITAAPGVAEAEALHGGAGVLDPRRDARGPLGRRASRAKRLAELGAPGGDGDDAGFAALGRDDRRGDPVHGAETRTSGVRHDRRRERPQGRRRRDRGAASTARAAGGRSPRPTGSPTRGATPLAIRERRPRSSGVIELKDTVKEGLVERFAEFRKMGIRTVMITGDNPRTAATIAARPASTTSSRRPRPRTKIAFIRKEQADGHLVAMTGDGTNDAPALAQSDVGLAMNSGTSAAKEAANMVDLDSDPTKLLEVIAIGKQLLITRGSITTFSIANDVAKYFAIVPGAVRQRLPGARTRSTSWAWPRPRARSCRR